jgi:galactokinase
MDQMACAVGGFVYMDFENPEEPIVEPIEFNLSEYGYELCIINTGGSHANLNEDYASVPGEMKNIARLLGREALRGLTENDIIKNIGNLRRVAGDRAVLRALHFMRENERVGKIKSALSNKDIEGFLDGIRASGNSSFKYLQNVYSNVDVKEQGISLALALADGYLENKDAAMRVHGGGFAGTIQVFVKQEDTVGFKAYMDKVFGDGAVSVLTVRKNGAIKLV